MSNTVFEKSVVELPTVDLLHHTLLELRVARNISPWDELFQYNGNQYMFFVGRTCF